MTRVATASCVPPGGPRDRARRALAALAALLVAPAACADARTPTWQEIDARIAREHPEVARLPRPTLAAWLEERRPVVLLDARSAREYEVSHLPGARHAPDPAAAARALEGAPPDAVVVAYCSVGVRSARLVEALQESVGRDVYNLDGSIFAWANEGRPVVRGGEPVRDVHPFDESWGTLLDPDLRTEVPRGTAVP